jgi:hypothetical protein
VVIDAFEGARVPAALVSPEALLDAARVAPLLLINLVDDRTARVVNAVGEAITGAFPGAWRIQGRSGNRVLVGGELRQPTLHRIAGLLAGDPSPAGLETLQVSKRTVR